METRSLPDSRDARRAFARAAATARGNVVARETARRMATRLKYVKIEPRRVLDAGCGAAEDEGLLRSRYPGALIVGSDFAWNVLHASARARTWAERARALLGRRAAGLVCADMERMPFGDASFGLVWSNLSVAWAGDPGSVFMEFNRILEPGGLLMFCSYGPDTLKELRAAFADADERTHVHRFFDMHDLGDMLVGCGFAAPVMDMEMLTLTYEDCSAVFRDLRRTGQTNVANDRRRTLTGRERWSRMMQSYERLRSGGRIPATLELVYGHAWKGKRRQDEPVPIQFHPKAAAARR